MTEAPTTTPAPNTCEVGEGLCTTVGREPPRCGDGTCVCHTTANGTGTFCGAASGIQCLPCENDADCVEEFSFEEGSACVSAAGPSCSICREQDPPIFTG